jgi:ATP-dependent Lon protease
MGFTPRGDDRACLDGVVPLFPLPDIIMFPGMLLPLHVFEPRYRQMVRDLLDGNGRLVMGTFLGEERETVAPLAGVGQIESYQSLEDGRYIIVVRGLERVHLHEVASDRLYRKVAIETAEEAAPATPEEDTRLREALTAAILERAEDRDALPDGVSTGLLADVLLLQLSLPGRELYPHFATLDVSTRAHRALDLHTASD